MGWGSDLRRWLLEAEPPELGIELRSGQMALARISERKGRPEVDLCVSARLPEGLVSFSMLEPNIHDPDELARRLRRILDQAGVDEKRLALTLPDTLARVSVQELPSEPRSRSELADLLRFRLKKSLPFDIDKARMAFQSMPGPGASFLTGVMYDDVVSQYEAFFEGMGFHVGVIEVASLSLLKLAGSLVDREVLPGTDYFFLNIEESYFTATLVRDREHPVLLRTLGNRTSANGGEPYDLDELLRELVPTLIFYREKLGGTSLARVYYRSMRDDMPELEAALAAQFEVPVEPIDLYRSIETREDMTIDPSLASAVLPAVGAALGKTG